MDEFSKKLDLPKEILKKISFEKATLKKRNNSEKFLVIEFSSTDNIFSDELMIILKKFNNTTIDDKKLFINNFQIKQENIKYDLDQIYAIINKYFLIREIKIEMKNFFLSEEKDFYKLIVADSNTYKEVRNLILEIKLILTNFSFIDKEIQLIQDGSYFDKEKMIEIINNQIFEKEQSEIKNIDQQVESGFTLLNLSKNKEKEKFNVYYEGKIFEINERKTKNNRFITRYYLENEGEAIEALFWGENNFKNGDKIRVYGEWKYNTFDKNFIFNIDLKVKMIKLNNFSSLILDNNESKIKRTELHTHSKMSVMDGVAKVKDYFEFANNNNIKSLAITDHNSVQSFPEVDYASYSFPNVKPIYGVEFNIKNDMDTEIVINSRDESILDAEYVFFDLETTGISPFLNEIIEFGAVKQKNGRIVEKKQLFIKPKIEIPEFITELTNITNDDVKDAPDILEALKEIKEWIGDAVLVAHNAQFDYSFLNSFYKRYGLGKLENPIIDSLKLSWLVNPTLRNHRLGTVARAEGQAYDEEVAHRADYDAEVLQRVYENMIHKLFDKEIRNINELNNQTNKIYDRVFENHINVLAKNDVGMKQIYKLVSKAHIKTFNKIRKEPSLFLSEILKNRENLLIGSSCDFGIIWEKINYDSNNLEEYVQKFDYLEIFPPTSYLHLERGSKYSKIDIQKIILKIIELGNKFNIPVVVTSDAHYVEKDDKSIRDVYITNKGLGGKIHSLFDRRNPNQINPDAHLRTIDELYKEFSFIKNKKTLDDIIINNPNLISDKIEKIHSIKKGLYPPKIEGVEDKFRDLIYENVKEIYGDNPDEYIIKRVEHEIKSISENGYAIIYYLSSILVKKSLKDGYLVGSRGSVGSSVAATFTDITEVNPLPPHYICKNCKHHEFREEVDSGFDLPDLKCPRCGEVMIGNGHNIPFETFLGFKGDKVPDIDLNFSRDYQAKIHNYTKEYLGEKNVFRAGTISTVAEKTAFGYVKNYIETIGKENEFNNAKISLFAKKAEGTKRTTGQHPGGLIVVPDDMEIYDFTPINFPGNDLESNWLTTHFDFHSIHDNLLKLDLLGHLDPSIIRMLQNTTGIDPLKIPMNDKEVLSLFESADALNYVKNETGESLGIIGIPEFGTKFVRDLVRDAKPKSFADLVRISGLSHGTDVWVGNAKSLIDDNIAILKDVISVRDDIMTYLISKGLEPLTSFKIMESVRKGNGLTEEWESDMKKNNVPDWYIDSCKKIKYMFPKAHATAYVMMAFRIAWYKINYPLEYYATFFTKRDTEWDIDSLYKGLEGILEFKNNYKKASLQERTDRQRDINDTYDIVVEMYSRGFKIQELNLEKSRSQTWIVEKETNSLIPPFSILEGLGGAVAQKMVQARDEKPYETYEDFVKRSGVNKTLLAKLKELGVLNNLKREQKETKQMSLNDIFNI